MRPSKLGGGPEEQRERGEGWGLAITVERGSGIGQGIYSLGELRRYVALDGTRADADRAADWLRFALNPVRRRSGRPDYSFSDLISLFVVRELRRRGVGMATIREAERHLRKRWKTDRPFVSDEIMTDGRGVFTDDDPIVGQIESADRHGQQVMRELIADRLSHVHYHEGFAAYWTPMTGILIDPRVQFGEPVIEGTRVPTEAVADTAKRVGAGEVAEHFGISATDARVALAFETRLAALDI